MNDVITIALADDHTAVRQGMRLLLNKIRNFQVLFDVPNGDDLLERLKTEKPDILLLDIEIPPTNGKVLLEQIKCEFSQIKVIMFTMHESEQQIAIFVELGARAYLPKSCDINEIVDAINSVQKNGFHFSKRVLQTLSARKTRSEENPVIAPSKKIFTKREVAILELLRSNKSNIEISEILGIGVRTVEGHRLHLLQKSQRKNLTALLTFAVDNDLISITPQVN